MEEKLREYFEEMVVYKDLKNNTGFFSSLGLPAFLRDYLLKTFSDEYGRFNMEEVSAFVKKFIPKKEDWMSIKNKIIYENENVQILTKSLLTLISRLATSHLHYLILVLLKKRL